MYISPHNHNPDPFEPISYERDATASATTDPSDDPHLVRLVERSLLAKRMYPAIERLLAYLTDSGAPGWANTTRARSHLHREIGDALSEDDSLAAALHKIRHRGEMEASLDEAFDDDVFADLNIAPDSPKGKTADTSAIGDSGSSA